MRSLTQTILRGPAGCWLPACWALTGCAGISIAPSCPHEMEVGQTGTVRANELNPGAIPTYFWQVIPQDAGTFADPSASVTSFQAAKEGEVTIRLTATDGLFQVISECRISVIAPKAVAVLLEVEPDPAVVGEVATLSCRSVGEAEATAFTLEQIDEGAPLILTRTEPGVATFTPSEAGELTFRCTGSSPDEIRSATSTITVSVIESSNATDDDGRPSRPGRRGPAATQP